MTTDTVTMMSAEGGGRETRGCDEEGRAVIMSGEARHVEGAVRGREIQ